MHGAAITAGTHQGITPMNLFCSFSRIFKLSLGFMGMESTDCYADYSVNLGILPFLKIYTKDLHQH